MRVNWNDYESMHRDAAAALGVTRHHLYTLHHLQFPPLDLAEAGVEALIGHRYNDLSHGSSLRLVLMDVEFHSAVPEIQPEVVRRVVRLPRQIGRMSLLQRLGLREHCRLTHHPCMIWHNGKVLSPTSARPHALAHGHYLRIAVPPGEEAVQHIATRCVASACQQGITTAELCDRHALYLLGWYDTIVGHPLVPLPPDDEDSSMLQLGAMMPREEPCPWFLLPARQCCINAWDQPCIDPNNWKKLVTLNFESFCTPQDRLDEEPPHRQRHGPVYERPIGQPANPLQGQPAVIQELFMLWLHVATTQQGGADTVIPVETWYLSEPGYVICSAPRTVNLGGDFQTWLGQIIEEWDDVLDRTHSIQLHAVRPMPRVTIARPQVRPHIILKQRTPVDMVANLYTVLDSTGDTLNARQFATFGPWPQTWYIAIRQTDMHRHCDRPDSATQCMVWHGDFQLRAPFEMDNRDGFEFTVIVSPTPTVSHPNDHDPWHEDDEEALLQTLTSRVTLQLDRLVPQTTAVRLLAPIGTHQLPTPLEVEAPGDPQQIADELTRWGHDCRVFACEPHNIFLCILTSEIDSGSLKHYVFCHDDIADHNRVFCHSAESDLSEIQLMSHLCGLGYSRAVILEKIDIAPMWTKVQFHHCEPELQGRPVRQRTMTPWPQRGNAKKTSAQIHQRSQCEEVPTCLLRTPFNQTDLDELFNSSVDVLCTDFSCIELPLEIHMQLQELPIRPLTATADLDQYDRILIYTDGSSQPSMRRHTPQRADELGHPDTWSMIVICESFITPEHSQCALIGWSAHPVRYDRCGSAYMQIDSMGSDMAERAALIGAGAYSDWVSTTQWPQCFALIRAPEVNKPSVSWELTKRMHLMIYSVGSFKHWRPLWARPSLFCITCGRMLVTASTSSLMLQQNLRQRNLWTWSGRELIDLQRWYERFKCLWIVFQSNHGLPQWHDGVMDAAPPDLPPTVAKNDISNRTRGRSRWLDFTFSLGTANVNALSRGQDGHAGKLHYLQDQMRALKLNCVAIQEARTEQGCSRRANILRLCSGHHGGQYGMELWLDLDAPYATDQKGKEYFFRDSHFLVVHRDPRRLLVRCDAGHWSFWIFALHALHSGYRSIERDDWWTETASILQHNYDDDPLFVLADANAEPGDYDGVTVQTRGFATSPNTQAFRMLLQSYALYLPATSTVHSGPNSTWSHYSGLSQHCLDHIAIPLSWQTRCTHSEILDTFDMATVHDDHKMAAIQLQWRDRSVDGVNSCNKPYIMKAAKYHHHPGIHEKIMSISPQDWQTNVEWQTEHITCQLHDILKEHAVNDCSQSKKLYVNQAIWDIRTQKIVLRKKVKAVNHRLRRELLYDCFLLWKRPSRHDRDPSTDHHIFSYGVTLRCKALHLVARLRAVGLCLRQELTRSKSIALNQHLEQLPDHTSAADFLRALKPFTGPTNPKKAKQATLTIVKNDRGERCQLPCEATEAWINFFQNMEAGRRMPFAELRKIWIQELACFQQSDFTVELPSLPSLTELERALRRVPHGKAHGPDGLPGELCHYQPAAVARLLYPGLLKTMLHGHEPLVFKGGKLIAVYKGKGAIDDCASFRSLLISNHLGKAVHRAIRQRTASVYEAFIRQQTGGRRGIPVQLALHQARAFCRSTKAAGASTGVLFVDLTEAFYQILREVPLGGEVSDEVLAHIMMKMRMPADSLHRIHELLQETPAIVQAGLDMTFQRSFRAIHCSTHFWMRDQEDVSRTSMGTRPGDSFADIVFGYAWRTVLAKLEKYLLEQEWLPPLTAHHQLPLFGHSFEKDQTTYFLGPTWMDDLAACVETTHAESLPSIMANVGSYLLDLCAFHCLSPNLSPGKTELLMGFRGAGSRKLKLRFYGPKSDGILPLVCEDSVQSLRIVSKYKHLGGICHHSGDQRQELKQRAAMAHRAFTKHRWLICHNSALPLAKRTELFQMLILSKLLYGAESWVAMDAATQQSYHVMVMKLYRRLARIKVDDHFTDDEILTKVQLPSPSELLRRARLRYFVTLVKGEHEDAWTLLARDNEWRQLLEDDMIWMWHQLHHASELKDPREHYTCSGSWQYKHVPSTGKTSWRGHASMACNSANDYCKCASSTVERCSCLSASCQMLTSPSLRQPCRCPLQHLDVCNAAWDAKAEQVRMHTSSSGMDKFLDYDCYVITPLARAASSISTQCRSSRDIYDTPPDVGRRSMDAKWSAPWSPAVVRLMMQHEHWFMIGFFRLFNVKDRNNLRIAGGLGLTSMASSMTKWLTWLQICTSALRSSCFLDWSHLGSSYFMDTFAKHIALPRGHADPRGRRDSVHWHGDDQKAPARDGWPYELAFFAAGSGGPPHWHWFSCTWRQMWSSEMPTCTWSSVPRPLGRHRVILHLYSGRRRRGDVQFYLDRLSQNQSQFYLHIVSLDIVIDTIYGDAMRADTCDLWLSSIRSGYVIAMLAGPPCESWSRARGVPINGEPAYTGLVTRCGPRIIRDLHHLWGLDCVTLRELEQLKVGNALLGFTLLALLEMALADGQGMVEHPAEPLDLPQAASIWRLPLVKAIMQLPNIELLRFSQGLMGAKSHKPTHLLLLNLPQLLTCLHANRVRCDIPRTATIGKDQSGNWSTAVLKEYPPAMCKAVAHALCQATCDRPVDNEATEPPADFLDTCKRMHVTAYGESIGADYVQR